VGNRRDFLLSEGDTDGDRWLARAQCRNRHVVVAGAVADAVAAAVEGEQRYDQNVGKDLRGVGFRLADPPDTGGKRLPDRIDTHDQRLAPARHHRQRQRSAGIGKLLHQRKGADLALERHEARDDRAGRQGNRKRPLRNRLRGGGAEIGRERVAARERIAANGNFQIVDRGRALL
jgi:hypothetical protein